MGVYTSFIDGYGLEAVYGTSIITAQGDTTYLFGAINQNSVHPSPVVTLVRSATGINSQELEAGATIKGRNLLTGLYGMFLQNAIPIWAIMGKSASTGPVSDIYTHTITPPTAVSGVLPLLPSFTIQHELSGTATDYQIQFTGVKMSGMMLKCGWQNRGLTAIIDWIAQDAVKGAVGVLTNAPILPPTANEAMYMFPNMTCEYDSVSLDGLEDIEITINPDLEAEYVHRWDGSNNYTGRNLLELTEGTRKMYSIKLMYTQHASTIFEDLIATGNNKELVVTFVRDATDDYIEMTFTDCQIVSHQIITPEIGEHLSEEVIMEPRALSISVKDKINGSPFYGE